MRSAAAMAIEVNAAHEIRDRIRSAFPRPLTIVGDFNI
jgi:hypothetical protein